MKYVNTRYPPIPSPTNNKRFGRKSRMLGLNSKNSNDSKYEPPIVAILATRYLTNFFVSNLNLKFFFVRI